jgi:hypothetical protein
VPLGVESTAHVRIAGRSGLTMTYQYEMVNGRAVTSAGTAKARVRAVIETEVP